MDILKALGFMLAAGAAVGCSCCLYIMGYANTVDWLAYLLHCHAVRARARRARHADNLAGAWRLDRERDVCQALERNGRS